MKSSDCKVIISSAIDSERIKCERMVQTNITFRSKHDNELECQMKLYCVNTQHKMIIGLDFLGSADIFIHKGYLIKRFRDSKDKTLSYRMQIPVFEYDYSGEKFKNVQIMSCVEISKLKLSIREKMDMKNLLVGAKEKLEIEKALSKHGPDNISSTMDGSVDLEKLATNNSKNNVPRIDISRGNTSKIENSVRIDKTSITNNSPKIDGITKTKSMHEASKKHEINLNTVNEDELVDKRNFVREIFRNMIVDEIPVTTVPTREEFDMHIKIKSGEKPIKRNCGRRSPEQHKAVIEEAARLMKLGIIEESVSEYSAIPFFAKDHTGKKRFVIDYRALNEQTVEFAFPMPNADDILEKTKNAVWVGNKLYQFKRCAFGLKNSPAYFNRWIQSMLGEYENFALAYVDDVVIFSNSLEEHMEHLKLVLLKLQTNSVYLSNHKCKFFEKEVEFVGHTLNSEGIMVRNSKVEAILNIPEPTTVKQVRAFIGSCNYYKKFIRNFADLTHRLIEFTKSKTKKVQLDDETRNDIKQLKLALTSAPLLIKPDYSRPFRVYIDASDHGTGTMITQTNDNGEDQPVLYYSKKFNKFQKNYSTTDREFLALTNALNKYEYMLIDNHFEVFTDHLNLTYYKAMKDPPKRLVRALELISRFKFTITYIPGEKNYVADMLSRNQNFVLEWDNNLIKEITNSYTKLIGKERTWFETMLKREDVVKRDGAYYFIDPATDTNRIVVVDKDHIKLILDEAHQTNYSGHLGKHRLGAKVRNSFVWPRFWDRITNYVLSCVECQKSRLEQDKHGQLQNLQIPAKPWDDISMDFLNLPITINGNDCALVIVCRLSKMVKIIPCKRTTTAAEVAELFWKKIVCVFGLPLSIVSDNDKLFTSELWDSLMKEVKVKLKTTAPARPQADGQTERMNRVILEILSKMTSNRSKWDDEVPNIELAINTAVNSSTKLTPASIVYGHELRVPLNINTTYNLNFTEGMEFFSKIAQDNILEAQVQQAIQYNKTKEDIEYDNTSVDKTIVNNKKGSRVVNVGDIKPFIEEDRELFNRRVKVDSVPLEDEVDKIVNKRNRTYGSGSRIEYLIRFKNSSEDHDKWVPLHYLDECQQLVKKFEKENEKSLSGKGQLEIVGFILEAFDEKAEKEKVKKEKALKEKTENEKAEKEKVEKENADKEKAEREKSKSAVSPATTNQNSNKGNVEKGVAVEFCKAAGAAVNVIQLTPIPNAANTANAATTTN
ncbi:hypothetical protein ACTFIW_010511 [Dictyostelium discoideum]